MKGFLKVSIPLLIVFALSSSQAIATGTGESLKPIDEQAAHLPNKFVDVAHYDLTFEVPGEQLQDINGVATITLVAKEARPTLDLHIDSKGLVVSSVVKCETLEGDCAGDALDFSVVRGPSNKFGLDGSVLKMSLKKTGLPIRPYQPPFPWGSSQRVKIQYKIKKSSYSIASRGFGFQNYQHNPGDVSRWFLGSESAYTYARWIFPSNDHPSDPAKFRFTLIAPRSMVALASGKKVSESTTATKRTTVYSLDTEIPTYLARVVFSKSHIADQSVTACYRRDATTNTATSASCSLSASTKVPMTLWDFPVANNTGWVSPSSGQVVINDSEFRVERRAEFRKAKDALVYFSGVFGPYPFAKADFVYSDQRWNMEYASLIHMSGYGTASVHELVHQWWGDSVRFENYGDLWISEGFTTYFTTFFREVTTTTVPEHDSERFPTLTEYLNDLHGGPNSFFDGRLDRPAGINVMELFEVNDGALSIPAYVKGSWAIHDLRKVIGGLTGSSNIYTPAAREKFLRVIRGLYNSQKAQPTTTKKILSWLKGNMHTVLQTPRTSTVSALDAWESRWFCLDGKYGAKGNCTDSQFLLTGEDSSKSASAAKAAQQQLDDRLKSIHFHHGSRQ